VVEVSVEGEEEEGREWVAQPTVYVQNVATRFHIQEEFHASPLDALSVEQL